MGLQQGIVAAAVAPSHHAVHFYDADTSLVKKVTDFVREGLATGESAMVVATAEHLRAFESSLERRGVGLDALSREQRWLVLSADELLNRLMVDGSPSAERFEALVMPPLQRLRLASGGAGVRVFGEMVDLLWKQGNPRAVVQLEKIWNEAMGRFPFSLLCGYGLNAFAGYRHAPLFSAICSQHGASSSPADDTASQEARAHRVAELEQRARSLELEVLRRSRAEGELARLYRAEQSARAETAALYRLTDAVNRATTLEDIYQVALDGIVQALAADRASILTRDATGTMRFRAWRGLTDGYRAAVDGHSPWRPDEKQPAPVLVEDAEKDPAMANYLPLFRREGIRALGFFPLCSGGVLLGKFMVYFAEPHPFSDNERRLAEALADQIAFAVDRSLAQQERDQLIGIVSHDLRNPLNAIGMSASMLMRRGGLDGYQGKAVARILASAERAGRLTRDFLDLAQVRSSGGISVQPAPADLHELTRLAVDEVRLAFPDRPFSLEQRGDGRGRWDADRIAQVIGNLVSNAFQHSPSDVEVRVRSWGEPQEVSLEVANGGPPIPAGDLPRLFQPFTRGGGATMNSGRGVGLGLYIAHQIVLAHGGRISVRSQAGQPTTFTATMPRGAAAPSPESVA